MQFLKLILTAVIFSACATKLPTQDISREDVSKKEAMVIGYVKSIQFDGQLLPPGSCKISGGTSHDVRLEVGKFFRLAAKPDDAQIWAMSCNPGFWAANYYVPLNIPLDVKAGSVNYIGELNMNVKAGRNPYWANWVGGNATVIYNFDYMYPERQNEFIAQNPELKGLPVQQTLKWGMLAGYMKKPNVTKAKDGAK